MFTGPVCTVLTSLNRCAQTPSSDAGNMSTRRFTAATALAIALAGGLLTGCGGATKIGDSCSQRGDLTENASGTELLCWYRSTVKVNTVAEAKRLDPKTWADWPDNTFFAEPVLVADAAKGFRWVVSGS